MKLSLSKDEKLSEINPASELIKKANFSRISFALKARSRGFLERVSRLISRYTSSILREYSQKVSVRSCGFFGAVVFAGALSIYDKPRAPSFFCAQSSGVVFIVVPIFLFLLDKLVEHCIIFFSLMPNKKPLTSIFFRMYLQNFQL